MSAAADKVIEDARGDRYARERQVMNIAEVWTCARCGSLVLPDYWQWHDLWHEDNNERG